MRQESGNSYLIEYFSVTLKKSWKSTRKPPAGGSMLRVHTSMCGAYIYRKIVPLSETEKRGVLSTFLSAVKNVKFKWERKIWTWDVSRALLLRLACASLEKHNKNKKISMYGCKAWWNGKWNDDENTSIGSFIFPSKPEFVLPLPLFCFAFIESLWEAVPASRDWKLKRNAMES